MRFYGFAGESNLASLLPAILDSQISANFNGSASNGPVNPTFVLKKDNSVFSKLVHLSVLPVEVRNYQVEQPVKLKFHNDLFDR